MSIASSQLYRIVFNGEVNRGHDITRVKRNLSVLFRTEVEIIDRLFNGRPVVLKQGLEAEVAIRYLSAMSEAGAVSRMEPMSAAAAKATAGFIERREAERRREADRRNRLRHESLMPDRRTTHDRRELDNA